MKKKFLSLIFAICLIIPCAIILTACNKGGGGNSGPQEIGIETIVKDDFENPDYYDCVRDFEIGNKEGFMPSDVKVYVKYADGTKKLLDSSEYTYTPMRYSDEEEAWVEYPDMPMLQTGETINMVPDHLYLIKYTYGTMSTDLHFNVSKTKRGDFAFELRKVVDLEGNSEVVEMEEGKDYYEIDYMYNRTNSTFPYILTAYDKSPIYQEDWLTEQSNFTIIEDKEEYYLAEDKNSYINDNYVHPEYGLFTLDPGNYLIFVNYMSTENYSGGISKNAIKLKINSVDIQPQEHINVSAGRNILGEILDENYNLVEGYEDVHIRYEDVSITIEADENGSLACGLGGYIAFPFDNSYENVYLTINWFDGEKWNKDYYTDIKSQPIKVQAYKDSDDKYYLAKYAGTRWFKQSTSTLIDSDKVEYVDYYLVEEYKNGSEIDVRFYLEVSLDRLSEREQHIVKNYPNWEQTFILDARICKSAISFRYDRVESNQPPEVEYYTTNPSGSVGLYEVDQWLYNILPYESTNLYTVTYEKPEFTGKYNGKYEIKVELANNPNICLVGYWEDEEGNPTAEYFGNSATWEYKINAVLTYNYNYVGAIEYTEDLTDSRYFLSSYLSISGFSDYADIYAYKATDADELLGESALKAKILEEGTILSAGTGENTYKFITDGSQNDIIGRYYFVIKIKDEEFTKWHEYGYTYIPEYLTIRIDLPEDEKIEQTVQISQQVIEIDLNSFTKFFDVADYVTLVDGLELYASGWDKCEIDEVEYTTSYTNGYTGSTPTDFEFVFMPEVGDVFCIVIYNEGNHIYKEYRNYMVLKFVDGQAE